MPKVLTRGDIEGVIPHREPFLFIDSVQILGSREASGIAQWPSGSPFFEGHFPGNPIVPGVFLIEAAAQTAAVLLGTELAKEDLSEDVQVRNRLGVLAGVRRFSIRVPVRPDDRVQIGVRVSPVPPAFMVVEAKGTMAGQTVFVAQLMVGAI